MYLNYVINFCHMILERSPLSSWISGSTSTDSKCDWISVMHIINDKLQEWVHWSLIVVVDSTFGPQLKWILQVTNVDIWRCATLCDFMQHNTHSHMVHCNATTFSLYDVTNLSGHASLQFSDKHSWNEAKVHYFQFLQGLKTISWITKMDFRLPGNVFDAISKFSFWVLIFNPPISFNTLTWNCIPSDLESDCLRKGSGSMKIDTAKLNSITCSEYMEWASIQCSRISIKN